MNLRTIFVVENHSAGNRAYCNFNEGLGKVLRFGANGPEVIERLLRLMKTIFDCIVIDSGQLTDTISMGILEMADEVLMIAIQTLPCLSNVNRILRLFYDLRYPPEDHVKIIINRYIKNPDISIKDAAESIGKKIFWTVPNDFKSTMSAINQGKVLGEVAAKSDVARSLRELAERLLVKDERRAADGSASKHATP